MIVSYGYGKGNGVRGSIGAYGYTVGVLALLKIFRYTVHIAQTCISVVRL